MSYLDCMSSFLSSFFTKINHDNLFQNLRKNSQYSPIGNFIISFTEFFENQSSNNNNITPDIIEKICSIINQWEAYFHKKDENVLLLFFSLYYCVYSLIHMIELLKMK